MLGNSHNWTHAAFIPLTNTGKSATIYQNNPLSYRELVGGILKRCIRSLSESRTNECLQEQKPDREHVRGNDALNPHPSPANHTRNRTGLDLPLQTAEFEAAPLQPLF